MKARLTTWLNSLTAKYVAIFTLLVAVPAIGISWYLLDSSYNDNKRALIRLEQDKAKSLAAVAQQRLDTTLAELQSYSVNRSFGATGPHFSAPELALEMQTIEFNSGDDYAGEVLVVDNRGHVLIDEGDGLPSGTLSPADVRRIVHGVRTDGTYYGPTLFDGLWIATAAYADTGIAGVKVDPGFLRDLLDNAQIGSTGYAWAVTAAGKALTYPSRLTDINSVGAPQPGNLPQARAAVASRAPTGWTIGRGLNGNKLLSAWATMPDTGWRIIVERPASAIFAPLSSKIWKTALLIAAFVAFAVALSILLARRFVRPIRRMRVAAARIGAGAYDERIELDTRRAVAFRRPVTGDDARKVGPVAEARSVVIEQSLPERKRQDDLGALADDFNRMAVSLQKSNAQLEQKVEERTRELQLALEQLAERTQELNAASEHKSEFLANMSHELRTPLNAILGFTQVLQQKLFGDVNEKQEEYLEDIHGSANHLLALINDVLDLSKVEAGQVELEKAPFSLREALERGVVMVRERATKNSIQLTLQPDPNVELVTADERRIRQVVFNLLSNAVKFTPSGGHVDVRSVQENGEVLVSVADSGPGIPPGDQERIFEEFQQTELGQEQKEGTGLGLALSRKLVELHGGRIWVESEPGKGTTFHFTMGGETQPRKEAA